MRKCKCGKLLKNTKKYCCKECMYKYRIRPKGLKYDLKKVNKGWFGKDHKPWNTGLTKETDERLISKLRGIKLSVETKRKISRRTKEAMKKVPYEKLAYWKGKSDPRLGFKKGNVPWNTGNFTERMINEKGYILVYAPEHVNSKKNGYVLEHRKIMSDFIGRKLTTNEVVHHIDQKPSNNNIKNLRLMSRSAHIKLHFKLRK